MSINVGDTFMLDGTKYSIKLIDLDGSHPNNKTGDPRIDASKFYTDEWGDEKIKKGRPHKFDVKSVCEAMGVGVPESIAAQGFAPATEPIDSVEKEWEDTRADKERIEKLINVLGDETFPDEEF